MGWDGELQSGRAVPTRAPKPGNTRAWEGRHPKPLTLQRSVAQPSPTARPYCINRAPQPGLDPITHLHSPITRPRPLSRRQALQPGAHKQFQTLRPGLTCRPGPPAPDGQQRRVAKATAPLPVAPKAPPPQPQRRTGRSAARRGLPGATCRPGFTGGPKRGREGRTWAAMSLCRLWDSVGPRWWRGSFILRGTRRGGEGLTAGSPLHLLLPLPGCPRPSCGSSCSSISPRGKTTPL